MRKDMDYGTSIRIPNINCCDDCSNAFLLGNSTTLCQQWMTSKQLAWALLIIFCMLYSFFSRCVCCLLYYATGYWWWFDWKTNLFIDVFLYVYISFKNKREGRSKQEIKREVTVLMGYLGEYNNQFIVD